MPRLKESNRYRPASDLIVCNGKTYDLRDYVVAHWGFESPISSPTAPNTTIVPDLSGNGRFGLLSGKAYVSDDSYPGILSRARLYRDASGTLSGEDKMDIEASSAFTPLQPFSISLWLKIDDLSVDDQVLFYSSDNYLITYLSGNKQLSFRFLESGDPAASFEFVAGIPSTIVDGEWFHAVFTYNGNSQIGVTFPDTSGDGLFYFNGARANRALGGATTGWSGTGINFTVGASNDLVFRVRTTTGDTSLRSFGSIEWWSKALTSEEIFAIYQAQLVENSSLSFSRSGFISRSPRLQLRELDDLPNAYPTVLRSGDATRRGNLKTSFDDGTTIFLSQNGNVTFPMMLPAGSSFIDQAVDIVGQESDITVSLPARSFQHPAHLHYSPVEELGPFDENRASPADEFHLSGTDPTVIPGFSSPLRSKIKIEIDITPRSDTTFTRNKASLNTSEGCPVGPNNTGFMYYNFSRREWEQIGLNDPATGAALNYDYRVTTGDPPPQLPAQFTISPGYPYIARQYSNLLGYDKIGTPTSTFGAPSSEIYHATSSQVLKMSDYISRPFLLESVDIKFKEIRAQRIQGRDFVPAQVDPAVNNQGNAWERMFHSGTFRDIDNYVFFAYRQKRNNRIIDSTSDVSSSNRYLIFSSSLTFWNAQSFASENGRSDFDPEKFELLHGPSFSYDFNLELSSTFDTRLTTWDPAHQTYRVDNLLVDVKSNVLAHFNFDDVQTFPGSVPDKSGNIADAILGPDANASVQKSSSNPPRNLFNAYYSNQYGYLNRGYLKNYDGLDGSLEITDASSLIFSSARSICFWIQHINPSAYYVLAKANPANLTDYAILFTGPSLSASRLEFRVYDTTATDHTSRFIFTRLNSALSSITGDDWHHIVCTWSGATSSSSLNIYVDGQLLPQTRGASVIATLSSAKTTAASPVTVGKLGSTTDYMIGSIASLEFYNTALSSTTVKSLYLLQQTHYTNPAIRAIGTFTGSFNASVKPAVVNRQVNGLSTYHTNGVQNAWIGGTAAKKYYTPDWDFGSAENLNPFLKVSGGEMLNANDFVPEFDSRAIKFLGNDSVSENLSSVNLRRSGLGKAPKLRADRSDHSAVSPYLLMPDDEIVFGVDAGLCSMPTRYPGNVSSLTGSHLVIANKECVVTLYGSVIENGVEGKFSMNQNLSSDSVHEVVGAEPVVDQFQIEPRSAYYGSYTDEIVTGSMAILNSDGSTFTIYDQDSSRRVIRRLSS